MSIFIYKIFENSPDIRYQVPVTAPIGRGSFAIDCGLGARQAALDNHKKREVLASPLAAPGLALQRLVAPKVVKRKEKYRCPIACSGWSIGTSRYSICCTVPVTAPPIPEIKNEL